VTGLSPLITMAKTLTRLEDGLLSYFNWTAPVLLNGMLVSLVQQMTYRD
jgi:hypothetical protein